MTAALIIGARTFGPADLLAWQDDHTGLSENERAALSFCQRWLGGAEEFVVHTSGSTGAPKPITLRREQMLASAQATGEALGLRAGMRALVCLPVRYIAGQMMLVRGLVLGLAMTVVEPAGDPLAGLPDDVTFDFTAVVPLQLQALLDGPPGYEDRLNRMQAILVGGATVSAALEQQTQALTAPVYHTYGMTETATHIALRRLNGPGASPVFHPLPGVEIAVDDRGCLRVKGPMTLDQWLQTNDLVEIIPSNLPTPLPLRGASQPPATCHLPPRTFRWLGRWDNVINSGGVKVQVEVVEAAVEQAWLALGLAEQRFFVAGVPDERLGEAVTLVIEGAPLATEVEEVLLADISTRLDRFQRPRGAVYRTQLVETATGKIDRQASQDTAADEES
jgi:O-succinylbenzoic acid--CoA ligase